MPIRHFASALTFAVAVPGSALAQSGKMTIVTVEAAALLCIYDKNCKVSSTDSSVSFEMPDIIGTQPRPRLHTRTVLGTAGSPAAGKTGYL